MLREGPLAKPALVVLDGCAALPAAAPDGLPSTGLILFPPSLTLRQNKLECLSSASFFQVIIKSVNNVGLVRKTFFKGQTL